MGVCEMTVKHTRLCHWIARPAKPGCTSPVVQSSKTVSCVSLSFRTHPCVVAFITHKSCINGIEMTFVWLNKYALRYTFYKFVICFIAVVNLGETCHLKIRVLVTVWWTMLLLCCYHCDCMQQHYDVTQFEYVL